MGLYDFMKALQIDRFGEPTDVLKLVDKPLASLSSGQVRVQMQAAGINPSDVGNVKGNFPTTTLPRIIGHDFAGKIIEGPKEMVGLEIWGTGGDLGFTRDGSHAEMMDIPISAVSVRPSKLTAMQAGVIGVPYTTAFLAMERAHLKSKEWILITGAAGAVGSAAIDLAYIRGAQILAYVKDANQAEKLDRSKVKAIAHADANDLDDVVAKATQGKGIDVALNGIGASMLTPLLNSLANGGRMILYSVAYGGKESPLDLFKFYRKDLQLIGVNTISVNATQSALVLTKLTPLFENGSLPAPKITEQYPLKDAIQAYNRVGSAKGKVVIVFE